MEKPPTPLSDSGAAGCRPSRLYIEPTTFCNLSCAMCVKQSADNRIDEGMLSPQTFERLEPALEGVERLIFSGIGEPLLHPELEAFIETAAQLMRGDGRIGLQTNGLLLSEARARSLLDAGLQVACISMDAASPESFRRIRTGGEIGAVENAVAALKKATGSKGPQDFRWGIEFVLMKQNAGHLPAVARWAADNGAAFLIVSNVVPYSRATETECVYSPNPRPSTEFYLHWKEKAHSLGLDLDDYLKQRWKYQWKPQKSDSEKAVLELGREMLAEAYRQNIPLHFFNLIDEDTTDLERIQELFATVRQICAASGVEPILPELSPRMQRECHFLEDGSAFVSWKGEVFPCYYLWHTYGFYQNGRKVRVMARPFGNVTEQPVDSIWNSDDFTAFREKVLRYDYPLCESCNLGPCNLFTEKEFEFDCYAKDIPCGCCPWCGGLLHCLQ